MNLFEKLFCLNMDDLMKYNKNNSSTNWVKSELRIFYHFWILFQFLLKNSFLNYFWQWYFWTKISLLFHLSLWWFHVISSCLNVILGSTLYLDVDCLECRKEAHVAERSKAADSRSAGATRARSNRAVGIPFYFFLQVLYLIK